MQKRLLDAAVTAEVPRFIPSDYSIDYTRLPPGTNRNLDLRREFNQRLDQAPVQATSILNGMSTDLLTGQAPVVLFGLKRVLYNGSADKPLDFTTIANTAEFTAAAALDPTTPHYLRVAGEVATVRGLQKAASKAAGEPFKLLRVDTIMTVTKGLMPASDDVFPPWHAVPAQFVHGPVQAEPAR